MSISRILWLTGRYVRCFASRKVDGVLALVGRAVVSE